MPDMDGREILRPAPEERPDQAVLVLSCLADVATKVDCLELGAQDYLTKPFSLAELLARVRVRLRDDGHPVNEVLRAGELVLDFGRLEAKLGTGPGAADAPGILAAPGAQWSTPASLFPKASYWPRCGDTTLIPAPTWSTSASAASLQTWLRPDQDGAW